MELLMESLKAEWQNLVRLSPKILIALIIFVIFIFLGRMIGRAVAHIMMRGNFKPTHRNFFRNLTAWLLGILGLIIALNLLGMKGLAASLMAGGGITAIILGFAFREIGENFLAGFLLAFSRPFEVGDLIRIDDFQGIVKDLEMRSTHIRSADGRDIYIPSSKIFNNPLTNFTKDGLRRLSFKVGIDYADDSEKARNDLIEVVRKVENVLSDPAPGAIMSALTPQFVELELFFWIDTFKKGTDMLKITNEVIERCRMALMTGGYTVSANVSTNLALSGSRPVDIQLIQ